MLVDSHVNLHGEKFRNDLDDVIARARDANIGAQLNICCNIKDFPEVIAVAERYPEMWASIGTHPHDAKDNPNITPEQIIAYCDHPKVIGVGETGLDFHYNFSEKDVQIANFQAHIDASRETQLPLIIHSRNADDLMADILEREMKIGTFPALLHCYTSGEDLAIRAADLGVYFSMSGILTFKNANNIRELTQKLPQDRIMIETDCPYLAPVPHRGRRNEPAYVTHVAKALGEVMNWSDEETAERTTDAFYKLFSKATRPKSNVK